MRVSIIRPDAMVVVDGEARRVPDIDRMLVVNLTDIRASDIHAVQIDGAKIEVEWANMKKSSTAVTVADMQPVIDGWTAQAPKPDPVKPPIPAQRIDLTAKLDALWDQVANGSTEKLDAVKAEIALRG